MRKTALFFLATYALTWASWFAAAALMRASQAPALSAGLVFLGTFAPAIVALVITANTAGVQGVRDLVMRLFQWRVHARWYVFALGFMVAVKAIVVAVHRVAFGVWPAFGDTPLILMFGATLISVVVLGQAGEELGWRGFALPNLAARIGLGWASIVVGVVWAIWHLPIFIAFPNADKFGQSFPVYFVQVVSLSVVVTWLWARTGESLLLTMILHAAVNNTKDIVPSVSAGATDIWALSASRSAWLTVGVLWLFAAGLLLDMRGRTRDSSGWPHRP